MLSQLKANQGKQVVIELVNGSKIFGTISEVDEKILRVNTELGTATLLVNSVQVIWGNKELSLTEKDIAEIVEKVSDISDKRYICLGSNGFSCPQNYTCRPPHACNNFSCPGFFNSGFVPPDQPCVGQFYGIKRQDGSSANEAEECSQDNKETKE